MISLLEREKFADGRNILNFSVDTIDELISIPYSFANRENIGHSFRVPAVGSTATLEDTGETIISTNIYNGNWLEKVIY